MPYLHVADSSLSLCTCSVLHHPLNHLRRCMELSPSVTCSVHNNQTHCRFDFLTSDPTYINRTEVFEPAQPQVLRLHMTPYERCSGLVRVSTNYSEALLFDYWVSHVSKKWRLIITHHEALCNAPVNFSVAPSDESDDTCERAHAGEMVKCIRTIRTGLAECCLNSH